MKILLTGASSYVGARLHKDLKKTFDVVGTYHGNQLSKEFVLLDVTNKDEVNQIVEKEKPDVIVHVAANANARWCEANPELAKKLNEDSTKFLVDSANRIGAKVIFLSSFAAMDTSGIYGTTKKHSEEYVTHAKMGFLILRPSLIIGFSPNTTNDRPFNRILKNIDEKIPAEYDTSWKFQPTFVGHISEVISQVIDKNIFNTTIHIAVPELKSRYDIAKDILSPFGISVTPLDKKDTSPIVQEDLHELKELGLVTYSYQQIIEKIIWEIQHREEFLTA